MYVCMHVYIYIYLSIYLSISISISICHMRLLSPNRLWHGRFYSHRFSVLPHLCPDCSGGVQRTSKKNQNMGLSNTKVAKNQTVPYDSSCFKTFSSFCVISNIHHHSTTFRRPSLHVVMVHHRRYPHIPAPTAKLLGGFSSPPQIGWSTNGWGRQWKSKALIDSSCPGGS